MKILTEDKVAAIAQQPPSFRRSYSRCFNRDGKTMELSFHIIFRRGKDHKLVVPEGGFQITFISLRRWGGMRRLGDRFE